MDLVPYIDSSGARALESFVRQASGNGARVMLCDLRAQPAAFLDKAWSRHSGAERLGTFAEALSKVAPSAPGD
jgi:MFS superfamily sulfate permease-like transporter